MTLTPFKNISSADIINDEIHVSGQSEQDISIPQQVGTDAENPSKSPYLNLIQTESMLATVAYELGAEEVIGLSAEEMALKTKISVPSTLLAELREMIIAGQDPLGEIFSTLRSGETRRKQGAVFTPSEIVRAMVSWSENMHKPDRIIDPGAGSGRFLIAAGKKFPDAKLVAIEADPLAALLTRANIAVAGKAGQTEIRVEDFRRSQLSDFEGRTLYLGNPPYVRHHLIDSRWKNWLKLEAETMGFKASALAGLHIYFVLAIARRARTGDFGALITAAEWLEVNYGKLMRELFLDRLGGQAVHVISATAEPFPGTATTGAITMFTIGQKPTSARFSRSDNFDDLNLSSSDRNVGRERLIAESRWSHFTRATPSVPSGYVELGELCRVHRGQVTGANKIWIAGSHSQNLPEEVLIPSVTKAIELIRAGSILSDDSPLRRVIDIPIDLSLFTGSKLVAIKNFLKLAERMGAKDSYTATHRKAWWSVGLHTPAPILATYMARRPPAFVLNGAKVRHINIAHGLYPRESLAPHLLIKLLEYLRRSASMHGGRQYAGGLTKFEPREMERIPVPPPKLLMEMDL